MSLPMLEHERKEEDSRMEREEKKVVTVKHIQ